MAGLGLTSAYHHMRGAAFGEEDHPTYYHNWREDRPFHIDYAFIPSAWCSRLIGAGVADFASWKGLSDHRPLSLDLDLEDFLNLGRETDQSMHQ